MTDEAAKNKRTAVIALIIFLLLSLAMIIAAMVFKVGQPKNYEPRATVTIDKTTGQTIIQTEGVTEERFGAVENSGIIVGIEALYSRGLTSTHIDNMKNYLTDFSVKKSIKKISIDAKKYEHNSPNNTKVPLVCDDKATYEAFLDTSNIAVLLMKIKDKQGSELGSYPILE